VSESKILADIVLAYSRGATRLFRNNCGTLQDANGRYVKYGVGNPGGSDLIGITEGGILCRHRVQVAPRARDDRAARVFRYGAEARRPRRRCAQCRGGGEDYSWRYQ
jgi:hypothetical protein